jgi:hypothetical protein
MTADKGTFMSLLYCTRMQERVLLDSVPLSACCCAVTFIVLVYKWLSFLSF